MENRSNPQGVYPLGTEKPKFVLVSIFSEFEANEEKFALNATIFTKSSNIFGILLVAIHFSAWWLFILLSLLPSSIPANLTYT